MKEINIDGIIYVPKDEKEAKKLDGMQYVIIRTYSAGVHTGYLKRREGKEVELVNTRRIYYWNGAATLSQLSRDGVSKPDDCKFPEQIDSIILTEAIEIIPCTEKARKSIQEVKAWKE